MADKPLPYGAPESSKVQGQQPQ